MMLLRTHFKRTTEDGRLSRPKHCSKYAAYRGGFREKQNSLQRGFDPGISRPAV